MPSARAASPRAASRSASAREARSVRARAERAARTGSGSGRTAPSARARRRPRTRTRIRWDRVGRVAMLFVLGALLYLYVSAGASYISTWSEARHRTADLKRLKAENARLRAQKAALVKPTTVQEEARLLGMVKPGERAYVITGLPRN